MKPRALLLTLAFLTVMKSPALEPGGYVPGTEKAKELDKVLDSADREIECHEDDEFSIGVCRAGQELTFSLWELDTFLKEEKHKDCLVLDTGKFLAPDKDEKEKRKQFVDKLVSSFSKYGYRRILIIRTTGGGAVELIADVTPTPPEAAPAATK